MRIISVVLGVALGVGCANEPSAPATIAPRIAEAPAARPVPSAPSPWAGPWTEHDKGVRVALLTAGPGPGRAAPGGIVTVEYTAFTGDNAVWDSSYRRPRPQRFVVGRPIAGLPSVGRALVGARRGDRLQVRVPAEAGFGAAGLPERVPPGADLLVEVEVVDVAGPPPAAPTPALGDAPLDVVVGRGAEAEPGRAITFDMTTFVGGALSQTTWTRREPVTVVLGEPSLASDAALVGMRAGGVRRVVLGPETVAELALHAVGGPPPSGNAGQ